MPHVAVERSSLHPSCLTRAAKPVLCPDAAFIQLLCALPKWQWYHISAFSASLAWSNWPALKKCKKKFPNYAFMKKQTFKSLTEFNTELNTLMYWCSKWSCCILKREGQARSAKGKWEAAVCNTGFLPLSEHSWATESELHSQDFHAIIWRAS